MFWLVLLRRAGEAKEESVNSICTSGRGDLSPSDFRIMNGNSDFSIDLPVSVNFLSATGAYGSLIGHRKVSFNSFELSDGG